jgi:hypothetical protein
LLEKFSFSTNPDVHKRFKSSGFLGIQQKHNFERRWAMYFRFFERSFLVALVLISPAIANEECERILGPGLTYYEAYAGNVPSERHERPVALVLKRLRVYFQGDPMKIEYKGSQISVQVPDAFKRAKVEGLTQSWLHSLEGLRDYAGVTVTVAVTNDPLPKLPRIVRQFSRRR